ncbi:metalloenzyme [candidate division KSB1 bacterium]|nr:sulfatase-like hydrolase/transferase [candidate division KSB1 bacterium]RQW01775.1 MAG: metalloenzyme [candidate division KSB1 bacterium]
MALFSKSKKKTAEKIYRRPEPPKPTWAHLNNYIIVVLDSCRFDTFVTANPRTIRKLGELEKRYSYASWTAPSHYNMLMGLLPHTSPTHVYASDYYKKDFIQFNQRFGMSEFEFKSLVPQLYLPPFMREKLGYTTHALVSLPVLNPYTPINTGFDTFKLMDKHNDMAAMLDAMTFCEEQPSFYMLNVGETHYPYATPDEPENEWPRIHGVHGVFKHLDDHIVGGKIVDDGAEMSFFTRTQLNELKERQIHAIKYLDRVFEKLFDFIPPNTYITVTSDHGELFGEQGYFGHGPIMHEKVFEVPFLEGKLR